jgi:hypothetical protein
VQRTSAPCASFPKCSLAVEGATSTRAANSEDVNACPLINSTSIAALAGSPMSAATLAMFG